MASPELTHVLATRTPYEVYSYPATAKVFRMQSDEGEVHFIIYTADPASLFGNAPNGSLLADITNGALYLKVGTYGGSDGSWQTIALA